LQTDPLAALDEDESGRYGLGVAGDVRASDREREHVAARLREAMTEGRLEPDELEQRVQLAYAARTRSSLAVLTADLPVSGRSVLEGRSSSPRRLDRRALHLAVYLLVTVLLVCLWMADVGARDPLLVGDSEFPWPIFPIALWGSGIAWSARHERQRLLENRSHERLPG
jgi:hypothetical protein